jgi:hypothetical protein
LPFSTCAERRRLSVPRPQRGRQRLRGYLYEPLCPNEKIFCSQCGGHAPKDLSIRYHVPPIDGDLYSAAAASGAAEPGGRQVPGRCRLDVLEKFLPPCLLIDEQNVIRHIFGDCNNYLHFPAGKGELNLFSMLADDLRIAVSTALKTAPGMKTAALPMTACLCAACGTARNERYRWWCRRSADATTGQG